MKKILKFIFIAFLVVPGILYAQSSEGVKLYSPKQEQINDPGMSIVKATSPIDDTDTACSKRMNEAQKYLKGNLHPYNPAKALALYIQCAQAGVPQAMNIVAMLYLNGTGAAKDYNFARQWFEKAANANYPQAWYNLGVIYRWAYGVDQDWIKAYQCFKQAADMGDNGGMLFQGELLYKGLGCNQDYKQAFDLFLKGKENRGCIYMLALCYRNGYGVMRDTAMARKYLEQIAAIGYQQALDELATGEPENTGIPVAEMVVQPSILTSSIRIVQSAEIAKTPSKAYRRVHHNVSPNLLDGYYTGNLITYDWSGSVAIQQTPLRLQLTLQGDKVKGGWYEGDSLAATIEATYTDTSLNFTNVRYRRPDHYNTRQPLVWEFKKATFEIVKNGTEVHLAGNVYFYLPKLMQPAKPMYISLVKQQSARVDTVSQANSESIANLQANKVEALGSIPTSVSSNTATSQSVTKSTSGCSSPECKCGSSCTCGTNCTCGKENGTTMTGVTGELVTDILAYPNPFASELSLSFKLVKVGDVAVTISAISGTPVYQTTWSKLSAGRHIKVLPLNIPAGIYVVKIACGSTVLSTIVVKQ